MKKINTFLFILLLNILISPLAVYSQTVILSTRPYGDTVSGEYLYGNNPVAVTFNIENANDSPYALKQVEMIFNYGFFTTGSKGTLWYSSTSLAGPSVLDETGEWRVINRGEPITITEYNYYPLFQDLAFVIPPRTQFRFAVECSKGIRLAPYASPAAEFTTFTSNGIILRVGTTTPSLLSTDTVGCAGMPDLAPGLSSFAGRITLEPATNTPVTLLNLTATYNNKNANFINWQTSQEFNSSHFNVQRAYTLPNFATIKTLPAAGNSSTIKNYAYTDNNIEYKPTFYRLQQVDKDGQYTYSKTVQVNPYKDNFTISNIYPNPAHGSVTIEYNSNNRAATTLLITDMAGRQVQKNILLPVVGFNKQQINTATLAKGKYTITLVNGYKKVYGDFVKY